ncbi:helix-turn-helix transcriptional regulator [Paenibacillus tarimensis]
MSSSLPSAIPVITFLSPPLPYLIEADRKRYERGQTHPSRTNMGIFDLIYVREGALTIAEDKREWTVSPGQLLLLRPDRKISSKRSCGHSTVFDWLHFQTAGEWEESGAGEEPVLRGDHYRYPIRLPKTFVLQPKEQIERLLDRLHHAADEPESSMFWKRQQLFLQLLQTIDGQYRSSAASTKLSVAERAAAYMKVNYRAQVSNASLGESLQLHPNYIARCMIEIYGLTPQQYLLHYRIDQAKLLLIRTDWPVAKIAEETGFRQTPHFSRTFSEYTGISPLQYRKRYTV